MLQRDDTVAMELIETRRECEIGNAERAAMKATATDVQGLERCLKAMMRDVEAGRDDFKREIVFHLSVAEATQNRVRLFMTTSLLLPIWRCCGAFGTRGFVESARSSRIS
jgi:GntR family transcriptional regulator, transcriptional repressor for pyruvate dehydrogenase complex